MIDVLRALAEAWATAYSNSTALSTLVITLHVVSMFVAGGLAIGTDRTVLRAAPDTANAVRAIVVTLSAAHATVIAALAVTLTSGFALFVADWELLATSRLFWAKLSVIAVLLANGLRMRRIERAIHTPDQATLVTTSDIPDTMPIAHWNRLRHTALGSLAMWLIIVTLGVVLSNG